MKRYKIIALEEVTEEIDHPTYILYDTNKTRAIQRCEKMIGRNNIYCCTIRDMKKEITFYHKEVDIIIEERKRKLNKIEYEKI
jgi:hypothetical protein